MTVETAETEAPAVRLPVPNDRNYRANVSVPCE